MDVRTAFPNERLEEVVGMKIPDGVQANPGDVCLLKRSLYGLKQSTRCWNTIFNQFLQYQGFMWSRSYCFYLKHHEGESTYNVVV